VKVAASPKSENTGIKFLVPKISLSLPDDLILGKPELIFVVVQFENSQLLPLCMLYTPVYLVFLSIICTLKIGK